ncbi:hypothetical protein [Rhodococcoides kyotonense]|nr:hypothetical protein [Rhodococcus kyotonensis]
MHLTAPVQLAVDASRYRAQVESAIRSVRPVVDVQVRADWDSFQRQLNSRTLVGRDISIAVNVDTRVAAAEIDAFIRSIPRSVTIRVDADTRVAADEVDLLLRRLRQRYTIDIDTNSGGGLGGGAARLLSSLGGIAKMAGVAKIAMIGLGVVTLIPLIASAREALGVIALLPAAAAAAAATIATMVVGTRGVTDAITAGAEAANQSASSQADSAKNIERAQRGVRDAYENAALTAERGADSLVAAEESVVDAQKASKRAQDDLTQSRKDALEQIQDLNLELKGSALDERGAILSLQRAQERLRTLGQNGQPVTQLDVAEAVLGVDEAKQRIDEVRERNADLREDAIKANKDGIEGSEGVIAAKENVEQANKNLVTSERDLQRTQRDVARDNRNAQEAIADAVDAVADATKNANPALDKYNEALKDLSPNAQQFVKDLRSIADEWKETRFAVQDELFDGLGTSIVDLANAQMPEVEAGLSKIADKINENLKGALSFMSTDEFGLDLATIFDNTAEAVDYLLQGLGKLGEGLFDVATVGSEFLPGLMGGENGEGGFLGWAQRFADSMDRMRESGELKEWIQGAIDKFAELWHIGGQIVDLIDNILDGGEETGDGMLVSISQTLDKWNEFLGSEEGQRRLEEFFENVRATCSAIADIIDKAASAARWFRGANTPRRDMEVYEAQERGENVGWTPEQLDEGQADGAGFISGAWNAADNDAGFWGGVARNFNSVLGYNNETDEYDGGLWKRLFGGDDEPKGDASRVGGGGRSVGARPEDYAAYEAELGIAPEEQPGWLSKTASGVGNWFSEQGSEIGDMFSGPMTVGGKPISEIFDDAKTSWGNFTTSVSDTAGGVGTWLGDVTTRAGELGSGFIDDVKGTASDAWNSLSNDITAGWNEHIAPAWETLRTEGLGGLADSFLANITDGAVTSWGDLPSAIGTGVSDIVDKHFPGLKTGLDGVKGFFSEIGQGIKDIWSDVTAFMSEKINWVISNVINGGIGRAYSSVDKFLLGKLPDWNDVPLIGMETGGEVPLEPGTKRGKDGVIRVLAPGEVVMSVPAVEAAGVDNLLAFNAAAQQGKRPQSEGMFQIGMETGGRVTKDDPAWDALKRGHDFAKAQDGKPYQWAGPRFVNDSFDCSGFMSSIAAAILGQDTWKRYFYTGSFNGGENGPMGFKRGLGAGFSIGVHDDPGGPGGGHTAGTLSGIEGLPDINVESGGMEGDVQYGGNAAGASNGQFPWKYHLPIVDGAFVDPGPGGGGNGPDKKGWLATKAEEIIGAILSPIRDKVNDIGTPPPAFMEALPALFEQVTAPLSEFVTSKIDGLGDAVAGIYDTVKDAVGDGISWLRELNPLNRDTGGSLPPGLNLVNNATGSNEYVVNPEHWKILADFLAQLKAGVPLAVAVPKSSGDPEGDKVLADGLATYGDGVDRTQGYGPDLTGSSPQSVLSTYPDRIAGAGKAFLQANVDGFFSDIGFTPGGGALGALANAVWTVPQQIAANAASAQGQVPYAQTPAGMAAMATLAQQGLDPSGTGQAARVATAQASQPIAAAEWDGSGASPQIHLHVQNLDEAMGRARTFLNQQTLSFTRR